MSRTSSAAEKGIHMRVVHCFVALTTLLSLLPSGASMPRGLAAMARADRERAPPAWLQPFLNMEYFGDCPDHPLTRGPRGTGACNLFCTGCPDRAICATCLPSHHGHQVIQVRRSSNSNVVRVSDVEHLLQVSDVQPYLLNGHFAVFLKRRPMAGKGRAGEVRCEECERTLLSSAYRFCSMGCKLDALPNDMEFTVSFVVPPKSDGTSGETDSDSAAEDGEAGSSIISKLQSTMGAKPSSAQHGHSKGVRRISDPSRSPCNNKRINGDVAKRHGFN